MVPTGKPRKPRFAFFPSRLCSSRARRGGIIVTTLGPPTGARGRPGQAMQSRASSSERRTARPVRASARCPRDTGRDRGMLVPARAEGRDMARGGRAGVGAAAEGPTGEGPSAAMAEFEELLRRVITAPPRTYEEVKLGKRRRRDGATKGSVQHRDPQTKCARPKTG